jgi:phage-related protein
MGRLAEFIGLGGWHELRDDLDKYHYRVAYVTGSSELTDAMGKLGRTNITFHCRPERFMVVGSRFAECASGDDLENPTIFESRPVIKVEGSGQGVITVGLDHRIEISDIPVTGMTIDSQLMDCYGINQSNLNSLVSMSDGYPTLGKGISKVTYTGGVTNVEVKPNWWTL